MGVGEGIVIAAPNALIESKAKAMRLPVVVSADWSHPFERALILETGAGVQWDMLAAGFYLVRTWDMAAALSLRDASDEQGPRPVLACETGSPSEQERTRKIVRDLRMPVYASELVFVQRNETTQEFIETWRTERCHGPDMRLAFLRAFYRVKPRLCALPSIWMGGAREAQSMGRRRSARASRLVSVEVAPGRLVRCYPGQEDQVREMYARQRRRRERG